MVDIAQLVSASDCGSEGRGFESHYPPQKRRTAPFGAVLFFWNGYGMRRPKCKCPVDTCWAPVSTGPTPYNSSPSGKNWHRSPLSTFRFASGIFYGVDNGLDLKNEMYHAGGSLSAAGQISARNLLSTPSGQAAGYSNITCQQI